METGRLTRQLIERYAPEYLRLRFRFGAGIVIYWFGYLDKIVDLKENLQYVIVTDSFPDQSELILLKYD